MIFAKVSIHIRIFEPENHGFNFLLNNAPILFYSLG